MLSDESSRLLNKTGEQLLCDIACDVVGIKVFTDILDNTDLDPIYYCELVKLCPVVNCTGQCLGIDSFTVHPKKSKLGSTFTAVADITVYNLTGTGLLSRELSHS